MITFQPADRTRPAGDGGSIPLAMLLTLVGITLSTILATIVIAQITTTRTAMQRVDALAAAQAGIDVGVGHIRGSAAGTNSDGNPVGVNSRLPCTLPPAKVGVGGSAGYTVIIQYFVTDPRAASATPLGCGATGPASAPAYALLTSTGTEGANRRVLRATYTFVTSNKNIPGGLIHVFKTAGSADLCLSATAGSPISGQLLRVRACAPGSPLQEFAYTDKLNLVLTSTRSIGNPGMCLDAAAPSTASDATYVYFRPCVSTPLASAARQIWSFNDQANFQGATYSSSGGTVLSNPAHCFNVQFPGTASNVIARQRCAASAYDNEQTFSVDASVGAGKAGEDTEQLVNYRQFGRCLDVTNRTVPAEFLIIWPCKQAPNGEVAWNQRWKLPTTSTDETVISGKIITNSTYCLQSPSSGAVNGYAAVKACTATMTADLTWRRFEKHRKSTFSYTIQDFYGRCLTPTDPDAQPPDLFTSGEKISKAILAVCDGSTTQKWNAPPTVGPSVPLKDINEK